jgi:hypothetical protein
MSKPTEVTVEMALDRGLLAETSLHLLALMAGISQKEFAKIIGPLTPNDVRTELLRALFIKCELCDPAGVTKMAVVVLETVRWAYNDFPFDGTRNVFRIASKMCGAIELEPEESHSVLKRTVEPEADKIDGQFIPGDFNL